MGKSSLDLGVLPLGRADLLALPGQDAEDLGWLHDTLQKECKPRNLIERQWIYDLAMLMGRIAYLRQARKGIALANQRKFAQSIITPQAGSDEAMRRKTHHLFPDKPPKYSLEDAALLQQMVDRGFKPNAQPTMREHELSAHLSGRDFQENLTVYVQLDALEQDLLRERDRIIAQFDRRRRNDVAGAVIVIESKEAGQGGSASTSVEPAKAQ